MNQDTTQLNPDAFKAMILSKHPDGVSSDGTAYKDMDATELTKRVISKYPDGVASNGHKYSEYLPPDAPAADTPSSDTADSSSEPGLGSQLQGRASDASNAAQLVGQGASDVFSGNVLGGAGHVASGLIQGAGAVAGGIGDVVNKGLEGVPGVKLVEDLLGKGVGALASTDAGKAVASSIQSWSQAHPELSKDIGSGFNIVTAIPILKGLGVVKNLAGDAIGSSLKNIAEKSATKDITSAVSATRSGQRLLGSDGNSIIKNGLIDSRAINDMDIVDGKYSTQGVHDNLDHQISTIEDNELQPALAKVSTTNVADRQSIDTLRNQALETAQNEFKTTGQVGKAEAEINRVFDDYKKSYGDYVTLQDVNDMKRGIRKSVNFNSPKLESDVTYHIGQTLQKNVEDSAAKLGLGDVGAINKKMSDLIKAQNLLKHIEGKKIRTSKISSLLRSAGTEAGVAGGEFLGNSMGVPLAGAYAGGAAGRLLGKTGEGVIRSARSSILKRTGIGSTRVTAKDAVRKTSGLLVGSAAHSSSHQ